MGTLHRWSSSHLAPCSGLHRRVTRRRTEAREPRSWRCCAAMPPPAPVSIRAWPAACGPGSRMPPTTSSPTGASTRHRSSWGPANCSAHMTSSWATAERRPTGSIRRGWCTRCCANWSTPAKIHDPLADALDALRATGEEAEVRRDRVAVGGGAHRPGRDARTPCPEPARAGPPLRPGLDAAHQRPCRHSAGRGPRSSCTGCSTSSSGCRSPAPRPSAHWACRPAARGPRRGAHCTICRCSRPSAAARRRSAWPCSSRRRGVTASRTCARNTSGRSPRTLPPGWPRPPSRHG